ncbi:MAG: hypothetical protein KGZ65_06185 [Sphingomonadales bacterium]|nr:hypothetical protein [Sphingomonadaceae bacterium]MBS3930808.1 hypothetical protein [Sphingomonadales bacterium]
MTDEFQKAGAASATAAAAPPPPAQVEIVEPQKLEHERAERAVTINPYIEAAHTMEIATEADATEAAECIGDLTRFAKEAEARRKELKAPIIKWGKEIDAYFKAIIQPLTDARAVLEPKILDYRAKVQAEIDAENARIEAERQRQQELEDERQRKIAAEAAQQLAEAEASGNEAAAKVAERNLAVAAEVKTVAPAVEPLKQASTIKADNGASASVRKTWKHTITDPMQVPREYLIVDEKAIAKVIRQHSDPSQLEIPGVKIEQVQSLAVRT